MAANLCPILQESQFSDNGEFLVGGLVWFYEAGSSTLTTAWTNVDGDVAWSNPIVLNSRGESGGEIWLTPSQEYRIVLETRPAYGQTHGEIISDFDYITGVPVEVTAESWILFDQAPAYVSTTSFTVSGDYRSIFVANRKLQLTDTGGVSYHSVISSTFGGGLTTVNITGLIDSGLSVVYYSFIEPDASPDRFVDLYATGDLSVTDSVVVGGNLVVAGTASVGGDAVWTSDNNPSSLAASGYQKLENGLIMQWGAATTDALGAAAITFPTPFITAAYSVTATAIINTARIVTATAPTTTGFTAYTYDAAGVSVITAPIRWMAIGK